VTPAWGETDVVKKEKQLGSLGRAVDVPQRDASAGADGSAPVGTDRQIGRLADATKT
jgi:hypothetical protein